MYDFDWFVFFCMATFSGAVKLSILAIVIEAIVREKKTHRTTRRITVYLIFILLYIFTIEMQSLSYRNQIMRKLEQIETGNNTCLK